MNDTRQTWLALALGGLIFFLLLGFPARIEKQPDSDGYLFFASDIRSGALFQQPQAPWYSVIRTPGYPALLALSQSLVGENPASIVLVHGSLALLTMVLIVLRFKKYVAPILLVLLTCFAFWLWREYYRTVLSEWTALCGLLLLLCAVPQNTFECSPKRVLVFGILLSLLVLTRPALIALLILAVLFIAFIVERQERRQVSVGLLLGLMPLFLWCTYNSYRIGTFNVAAFNGHNLFGVASLLGHAEFKREEWPDLYRFSTWVNNYKLPRAGMEHEYVAGLPGNYFNSPYNHNVYQVALEFEKERNHPRQYLDEMMSDYAKDVLISNPIGYFKFILAGLGSLQRDCWLLIVSAVMLVMLARSGHPLTIVLAAALGAHLFHVGLCSAVQIVISRYYLLTMIPLGLVTVVAFLSVLPKAKTH